jgi:hypothetical protein
MRFFFSGPRVFGIRPGISLGASDFRGAFGSTTSTVRGRSAQGGTMTGSFLYVIEGESGHHKIGVSRDPIQRMAQLQTGSHAPLRFAYIGVTPGTGYDIEGRAHQLLDAHRKEGEWFLVPASIAIGATLEAASRLGEPIQQVQPEIVPQIIYLANQPDPNGPDAAAITKYNKRWGILSGMPWWLRYPIKAIATILIFTIVALSTMFIVFLLTHLN